MTPLPPPPRSLKVGGEAVKIAAPIAGWATKKTAGAAFGAVVKGVTGGVSGALAKGKDGKDGKEKDKKKK